MLTYKNNLKKLILPEYGRTIQNMVDHCVAIEDHDERMRCAETIVNTMWNLFPPTREPEVYRRKLWDHLAIMSDFRLNLDLPFDLVRPEVFSQYPDPVPTAYSRRIAHRQYGDLVVQMIDRAATMEPGPEQDALIMLLANHMKKTLLCDKAEVTDDARVFKDLMYLSHGAIRLDPSQVRLHEYKTLPTPSGKKKKKK